MSPRTPTSVSGWCAGGYLVEVLDATTWEEALLNARVWMGQRSRGVFVES